MLGDRQMRIEPKSLNTCYTIDAINIPHIDIQLAPKIPVILWKFNVLRC